MDGITPLRLLPLLKHLLLIQSNVTKPGRLGKDGGRCNCKLSGKQYTSALRLPSAGGRKHIDIKCIISFLLKYCYQIVLIFTINLLNQIRPHSKLNWSSVADRKIKSNL